MIRKRYALAALVLPVLLISIDMTILGFAVPALSADLRPSGAQLLWIVDIYSFLLAGLLVLMGSLGDRIGRRRLLLWGAALFGLASALAAFADSAGQLIAARALLGVGGATLMPATLSLIRNIFTERRQRQTAIAVWTAAFAAGAGLGPLLGGFLLEHLWWGSVFLVNVPLMLALLVAGPRVLPESRDPRPGPFDVPSAALSLGAVLPFVYGFKHIAEHGPGPAGVAALAAGLGLGTLFVRRQRALASPMFDVRLFAHRPFSVSVATNFLVVFALVGLMFFIPQYLQMVRGMSPLQAGLWTLPEVLATIAGTVLAARLARRTRLAYVIGGGLLATAAGFALVAGIGDDASMFPVVTALVVAGAGIGLAEPVTNDVIMASAPPEKAGAAGAISETAYELGGATGVAVLGSVASSVYTGQVADGLPDGLPAGAADTAGQTLGGALEAAGRLPADLAEPLTALARHAFLDGMRLAALAGAVLVAYAALQAAVLLRRVPPAPAGETGTGTGPVPAEAGHGCRRAEREVAGGAATGAGRTGPAPGTDRGPVAAPAQPERR